MPVRRVTYFIVGVLSFVIGAAAVWLIAGRFETNQQRATVTAPALPIFEKTPFQQPKPEPQRKISFSKDPFELKRLIDENRNEFPVDELWEYLYISREMKLVRNPSLTRDGILEFRSCPSCITELRSVDLDTDQEKEVILTISSHGGFGDFRMLVLDRRNGDWQIAGHTDHDINKYYSPVIRIEQFGKERFVVLTCQGGWGTGLRISFERWYKLDSGELRELISFPNESFTSQTSSDLVQDSRAKVVAYTRKNGLGRFTVEYRNRFSGYSECSRGSSQDDRGEVSLFTVRKRAVYLQAESGFFELDSGRSEISEEEIYKAHTPWGLSPNRLRKFYSKEIRTIQRTPSSCRATWLIQWLARADEFEE